MVTCPMGRSTQSRCAKICPPEPGCIAGALTDVEYRAGLAAAGFSAIDLEITCQYTVADIPDSATGWAADLDEVSRAELVGRFASTFVRATKPAPGS